VCAVAPIVASIMANALRSKTLNMTPSTVMTIAPRRMDRHDEHEIMGAFAPHYVHFINLAELEKKAAPSSLHSLDSIEKITKSGEMWFSNPLFMNDFKRSARHDGRSSHFL